MQATKPIYWTSDRIMRLILGVAITIGVVMLIDRLSDALLPFLAACVISYMLRPIVGLNRRYLHLPQHYMAVWATLLEVLVLVAILAYFFVPVIVKEVQSLCELVDHYSEHNHSTPLIPNFISEFIDKIDRQEIEELIESGKLDGVLSRGQTIISAVVHTLMHMLEWLLMFIYIIFIMLYYDEISTGFKKIAPRKYRTQALAVMSDVKDAMNHYFRGQGLMAICAMVLYSIGFSIVGLPMAIIMGITVGVLYMIPYFQYITIIPVAIICFITSLGGEVTFWTELAKCLCVYVVSQTICDYVLTPRVLGKAMGLNPAIILLALSVWGSLLGILGMLIALPATAVIFSYYERYISNR